MFKLIVIVLGNFLVLFTNSVRSFNVSRLACISLYFWYTINIVIKLINDLTLSDKNLLTVFLSASMELLVAVPKSVQLMAPIKLKNHCRVRGETGCCSTGTLRFFSFLTQWSQPPKSDLLAFQSDGARLSEEVSLTTSPLRKEGYCGSAKGTTKVYSVVTALMVWLPVSTKPSFNILNFLQLLRL